MRKFELIPHQADVRILAEGENFIELFTAANEGLCSVISPGFDKKYKQNSITEILKISSIDITALLIDFLSEVLSLTHQNKALFCEVNFEHLMESSLKAEIKGYKIDGFDEDVKAVTYHEAYVEFVDGMYQSMIVLDI